LMIVICAEPHSVGAGPITGFVVAKLASAWSIVGLGYLQLLKKQIAVAVREIDFGVFVKHREQEASGLELVRPALLRAASFRNQGDC
jgi:hypothetical protein